MGKQITILAGSLLALALFSSQAQAQQFNLPGGGAHSVGRPTVSPYMNLLTVDNFGIAGGYQTLVKPFVDSRKAINNNSAAIAQLQSSGHGVGGAGGGGGGGHGAQFMNYSHYYPGLSGR